MAQRIFYRPCTVRWRSFFFFQAEDGIRDTSVTGVQTCALPIYPVQCLVAVPPVVEQRQSVSAFDGVDRIPAADLGRDLEAAGEDHAIDFVLNAVGDDARLRSEERRVGEECRSRCSTYLYRNN